MKQEHEMTPGVLVSGEVLSAGDARARVAVLEAENADLRKRVCVPDASAMARVLSDRVASARCVDPEDNWKIYGEEYIEDVRAMLAAAPAPVERVEQDAKVFWVLFDNTGDVKYIKKDVYSGTLAFFDNEADASLAKQITPDTDYMRVEYYTTPQPAPTAAQDVAGLVSVLAAVQEQFKRYGQRFPDGLDGRVFRWVDDALAAHQSGGAKL
ncbi:MAG: hypothetical protein VX946_07145 [Pseudomonadota bacterium]|nr:hypothetical protein [Pseudomonadota bacterium]